MQAVVISLTLSDGDYGELEEREAIAALEARLAEALSASGHGRIEGHEIGRGVATIHIAGRSADAMAATVGAVLAMEPIPQGSTLTRRYGPPGSPAITSAL